MSGTNYFSYFPNVEYTDNSGSTKIVTDIFKRVKMRTLSTIIKTAIFYKYTIQDGERVEDIANRYYGDTQYYWLILYANDIINIYTQWPRSNSEFNNYIISKYESIEGASDTTNELLVHHYEDVVGNWINKSDWDGTPSLKKTIYDWEYSLNENKREINIVKREYLPQIIKEMNNLFSK